MNRTSRYLVEAVSAMVLVGFSGGFVAIALCAVVRKYTSVHNLTPLLLPTKNFESDRLAELLGNLFWGLAANGAPDALIAQETERFLVAHPWTRMPGDDRRCLLDGVHYFRSPGHERHGFFRFSAAAGHINACLLNARSRLGGTYGYTFHYDCNAVNGGLRGDYPNCHWARVPPKKHHVNIAPNDFIISTVPQKGKRRAQ
jgi:hypothetical protein